MQVQPFKRGKWGGASKKLVFSNICGSWITGDNDISQEITQLLVMLMKNWVISRPTKLLIQSALITIATRYNMVKEIDQWRIHSNHYLTRLFGESDVVKYIQVAILHGQVCMGECVIPIRILIWGPGTKKVGKSKRSWVGVYEQRHRTFEPLDSERCRRTLAKLIKSQ